MGCRRCRRQRRRDVISRCIAAGILKEVKKWAKFLIDAITPTIAKKDYPTALVKLLPNSYLKYLRKNDKTASPMRKFNKKKSAANKMAAFERMLKGMDLDSNSAD